MRFEKPVLKLSKRILGIAEVFEKTNPNLKLLLMQAEIPLSLREYIAYALVIAAGTFFFPFLACIPIAGALFGFEAKTFLLLFLGCLFLGWFQFNYFILLPKLLVSRRAKEIDKDLLFALRHLLIKIRSGITLFESMRGISKGGYGLVSTEFGRIIAEINAGKGEVEVLEETAYRNTSIYFRRALWQIASSMRAGADIGNTLTNIVNNLSAEQRISIRKYGSELSPLALGYMMITVIIPTLGVSLLIVLSQMMASFQMGTSVFYIVYGMVLVMQYLLIGVIRTRRPAIDV
jgi:flagellar protein FlaJ